MARVTCVSVAYGPTPEISRMLASLRRNTLNDGSMRDVDVCVVTQPSPEGCASLTSYPWVREIALDDNIGFGPANNHAVASCDSEYVAFLNPDLELTPGWLAPLVVALADPSVAVAAPVLLNRDGLVDEAGAVVCDNAETYAIGPRSWPGGHDEVMFARDVPYASAACWVMRRAVFESLGGFDPVYAPAYFEDPDLCFTAAARGLVTRLVVDRPVVHHHSAASEFRLDIARRSQTAFKAKWADVLATLPSVGAWGADGAIGRDLACRNRTLFEVADGLPESRVREVVAEAGALAAANPRDRVTVSLATLSRPWVIGLRRDWASRGLEIVESGAAARRPGWATDVRKVDA